MHTFSPCSWKAEKGGSLRVWHQPALEWAPGQPMVLKETLSWEKKIKQVNIHKALSLCGQVSTGYRYRRSPGGQQARRYIISQTSHLKVITKTENLDPAKAITSLLPSITRPNNPISLQGPLGNQKQWAGRLPYAPCLPAKTPARSLGSNC